MDHRLFENWLLSEEKLPTEKNRLLKAHLQECTDCLGLAEINLALKHVEVVRPQTGFSQRFQTRLAKQQVAQRRRNTLGILVLVFGGLGMLFWFAFPLITLATQNPTNLFVNWLNSVLTFLSSMRAVGQAGSVILKVFAGFIPPFAWMMSLSLLAATTVLWSFTFWKSARLTQLAR